MPESWNSQLCLLMAECFVDLKARSISAHQSDPVRG